MAQVLNDMRAAGVIQDYAVFGAVAQMRYTDPVATIDVDVLVAVPGPERLDILGGIYSFCASRGYKPEGQTIRIGDWPVHFLAAFDPLTAEALAQAQTDEFKGVPLRVVRPEHLAVIALSVGRTKDLQRICALLESGSTAREKVESLAAQHGLKEKWQRFAARFLDE